MLLSKNADGARRWIDDLLGVATLIGMVVALWLIFVYTPVELVQGASQKIFYIHLASIWNAYLSFFLVFVASILYLRRPSFRQRPVRPRLGGNRGALHYDHAHQRRDLGQTDLGDVLELGPASHHHALALAHLRGLSHAARFRRRPRTR